MSKIGKNKYKSLRKDSGESSNVDVEEPAVNRLAEFDSDMEDEDTMLNFEQKQVLMKLKRDKIADQNRLVAD